MRHEIIVPDGERRVHVLSLAESADIVVRVGKNAHAFVMVLAGGSPDRIGNIVQEGHIASGGRLHWFNVSVGGVEQSVVSTCEGRDAASTIDWAFRAEDRQRQVLSVRNVFDAEHGGGEITMKGVAQDQAHVAASGMIAIGLGGRGTQTYLTQNVLMLDPTAKVDAVPGLNIATNDVKASHSATVSRVTPEDLFTFGARGIPAPEARRMFIEGFLGALLERIPDTEAEERARKMLLG